MGDQEAKRVHLVNLVLMEGVDYLDSQENQEKKDYPVVPEDLELEVTRENVVKKETLDSLDYQVLKVDPVNLVQLVLLVNLSVVHLDDQVWLVFLVKRETLVHVV